MCLLAMNLQAKHTKGPYTIFRGRLARRYFKQAGPLLTSRSGPVLLLSEFWTKKGYSLNSSVTRAPPIAATTAEAFTTL